MADLGNERTFLPGRSHRLERELFSATSVLTRRFPRLGARFLDAICQASLGNPFLSSWADSRDARIIGSVQSFRRFLVIPDIHIGDAVMTQAAITALRDFFPDAEIDFVVNRTVFPLIEGNPESSRVIPLFSGGDLITAEDLRALREVVARGEYDICWNFGTFVPGRALSSNGTKFLEILDRSPEIVGNERRPSLVNHFIQHHYRFVRELLSRRFRPHRTEPFRGVRLAIPAPAAEAAGRFTAGIEGRDGRPLILLNPDGASPYTRVPFENLSALLEGLAGLEALILLNSGHSASEIGEQLAATLPPELRAKATIIPAAVPLEVYAGIIDQCDVFISGDTGPLHIAAARRVPSNGGPAFRNRTAVLACFGGTPSRMSGYDSTLPGYLPANQDAPSWTFTAASPCRNITCLNKMFKTCPTVRCFENLDTPAIIGRIRSRLAETRRLEPLRSSL